MDHAAYLVKLEAEGKELPGLFKINTLIFDGVVIDVLHCVDQGLSCHVVANTFVEVMNESADWGTTQAQRCASLDADLRKWYKTDKRAMHVQGKLTWERIQADGDWPRLKAKAAAVRHVARYSHHLSILYDDGSAHAKRRRAVNQLLCRFYEIIDSEGRYLSVEAKLEIAEVGRLLLTIYTQLSEEAVAAMRRAWKETPKFHLFQHLCEVQCAGVGNPKFYWVYADEDLQRIMKAVALSCHSLNLAPMVLYKWLVLHFDCV
jgi:hypothetical protein